MKLLNSPNLVHFYGGIENKNHFLIALEFCEGGNLRDKLEQKKYFNESEVLIILEHLFKAYKHLH